jgi:hypothetical protein
VEGGREGERARGRERGSFSKRKTCGNCKERKVMKQCETKKEGGNNLQQERLKRRPI